MELFITILPNDTFGFSWSQQEEKSYESLSSEVTNEPFLVQLVHFLQAENKSWTDIQKVSIIFSGERFSVARIVATIVNTLSFMYGFKVESLEEGKNTNNNEARYAVPIYKYPPHIGVKKNKV